MDQPSVCTSVSGAHVTTFDGRSVVTINSVFCTNSKFCKTPLFSFIVKISMHFLFINFRYYNNFNEGEFVLYKHKALPYEV